MSEKPHKSTLLSLIFMIFVFYLPAQAQNAAAAGKAVEVTLELAAHDKKGNAVLDLAPSEVQIVDAGKPIPLQSLRLITQPQVPPMVTLLFDEVVPGVAKMDHELAEEFLKEASGHGLVFTVLRGEGRLHLVLAPTADIEAVRKAVAVTTIADRSEALRVTEAAEQQMEDDARNASGSRQMMAKVLKAMLLDSQRTVKTDARSTPSVAALLAVSRGQQVLPGRKFVVFFSQGISYHTNTPETLRDIAQAANRAHVSIYAVDAEIGDPEVAAALQTSSMIGTEEALGNLTTATTDTPGTGTAADEFTGRIIAGGGGSIPHSLEEICLNTGGAHVYALGADNRSRTRGIADDLTSYYLASWIPPGSGDTNRRRAIRVQVLRKGVVIESRAPVRFGDRETVSAVEGHLIEALAAPKLPAGLPLNAAVLRFGNTPDNDVNSVLVQVPEPDSPGSSTGTVSVLAQLKDKSGAVVRKFSADIPRRRTLGDQQQSARDLISFRRQFSAPPGEYVLESVAMDADGGRIGAQRDNVVIPPVANGLALGDVLLVRRIDPADASVAADPLRCAEGIVVPNLSGHVSKAASPKISLFFRLHTDACSTEAPALSAELRRDGVLIGSVPLKLTVDPRRPTIPYMFALGAGSLRPGQYQVTVILSQGGQKAPQSVSFSLE
jgi:VWFA-related protein